MSLTHQSMIKYLLERYTQEELAELLDTSVKSIDNYQKGMNPSKKTKEIIRETYEKVINNNGKKISVKAWLPEHNERETERVMFKLLLDRFLRLQSKVTGEKIEDLQEDFRQNTNLILQMLEEQRKK
jgi:transcriptional regulator with XRE-family HTH domain